MNFDLFISIFFPRRCVSCEILLRRGAICETCFAAVGVGRSFFCGECESRIAFDAMLPPLSAISPAPPGAPPPLPARSRCHPDFPYLLGAAGSYSHAPLKALIHSLKFSGVKAAAEPLAALLVRYALPFRDRLREYVVVPVPLSRERLRVRGFNQAERIARIFAERMELPLDTATLARTKNAKPQSDTESAAERRENIRGCFAVPDPSAAAGKNFILIDDVTTSGATFLEAARALKSARAARIFALAVAKA